MCNRKFVSFLTSFIGAVFFVSLLNSCTADRSTVFANQESFSSPFFRHIRECVENDPALTAKKEVLEVIDALEKQGYIVEKGNDDLRIKYVFLQGVIEHVLACNQALGEVKGLVAMIHTPMVATPLCIKAGGPYESVLDESIRNDPAKLLTVQSRAHIVREFLSKGGKLHVFYPRGGLEKRTPEQQQIYREELVHFPNHLFDRELACDQIDPNMVGATYLFRTKESQMFAFAIKSNQANDIQQLSEWGMWFGLVDHPEVAEHVDGICDYLVDHRPSGEREYFENLKKN